MGCMVAVERTKAELAACDQRLAELRQQLSLATDREFDDLRCEIARVGLDRDWLDMKVVNEEWRKIDGTKIY